MGNENVENPKSNVIPRSVLCGFLSNAAVLAFVLNALAIYKNISHTHKKDDLKEDNNNNTIQT